MPSARPLDHEPFLVARSGREGAGRWRYDSARFRAPAHGVRITADAPDNLTTRLRALSLVLPPGWTACGPTAARLHDLPVPDRADGAGRILVVALPVAVGDEASGPRERSYASRAPKVRRRDVRWRRLELAPEDLRRTPDGLPVTSPSRTFVDLAAELTLPDLVAVGDGVARRGLATLDELAASVRRQQRRRGVRAARRAIDLVDPRAESPQESRARVLLVEAGLPAPTPNRVIRDDHGGFLARGDLVYERWRIVIEYDGAHHADAGRRARDATRRTLLREHGWYVVEITAADIRHPQRLVARVQAALRARGAAW